MRTALVGFRGEPQRLDLPSAPERPLIVHLEDDRPQPRLDLDEESSMAVQVGRIRPCPLLGIKMTLLGRNAEHGAASAILLNAELALATGHLQVGP